MKAQNRVASNNHNILRPLNSPRDLIIKESGSANFTGKLSRVNRQTRVVNVLPTINSSGYIERTNVSPKIKLNSNANMTISMQGLQQYTNSLNEVYVKKKNQKSSGQTQNKHRNYSNTQHNSNQ